MQPLTLSEVASVVGGRLVGNERATSVDSVALDSREVELGALFVALVGARVDGHDYAADAAMRGAVGALAQRPLAALPTVVVDEPAAALGRLGSHVRRSVSARVVAVTGSNGKTTVKGFLAAILSRCGTTLATVGNRNNELGLPQTLTRLTAEHRYAVIEMGANHPGEIARMAAWVEPDVGVVTNAGPAHLEGFGSVAGVARAKGELFAALGPTAQAVINADDPFAPLWHELAAKAYRRTTFGHDAGELRYRGHGEGLELLLEGEWTATPTRLLGRHNAANAAAAAAVAAVLGVGREAIVAGIGAVGPACGRLQRLAGRGCRVVLDDSYNANPASLQAALEVLTEIPGEPWLLLGEMAELGGDAEAWHRQAGKAARAAGVAHLWSVGKAAAVAAAAFGAGGRSFSDPGALMGELGRQLPREAVVLIKGSRAAAMERLVEALTTDSAETLERRGTTCSTT